MKDKPSGFDGWNIWFSLRYQCPEKWMPCEKKQTFWPNYSDIFCYNTGLVDLVWGLTNKKETEIAFKREITSKQVREGVLKSSQAFLKNFQKCFFLESLKKL